MTIDPTLLDDLEWRGLIAHSTDPAALREALTKAYPEIEKLELIDFKVRILDASHGTDAITRVLIETSDGETSWDTIGVAGSILGASWRALTDGIVRGLIRQGVPIR